MARSGQVREAQGQRAAMGGERTPAWNRQTPEHDENLEMDRLLNPLSRFVNDSFAILFGESTLLTFR